MKPPTPPHIRFRKFRERAGLSPKEAAEKMGILPAAVYDIETDENDLALCYSPDDVRRFCLVLGVRPAELFSVKTKEAPVSAAELVTMIHKHCEAHKVTLEQFEDLVGWSLQKCLEPPELLLQHLSLDGLQDLCRELGIPWHRVILGL